MKRRYRILVAVAGVLALLAVAGAILFTTHAGLEWAVGFAQAHSGGTLRIGAARGRLAGPLTLSGVELHLADATVEVGTAHIEWNPWSLLAGRVHVTGLDAAGVSVAVHPSDAGTAAGPPLPGGIDLPVGIDIDSFVAHKLEITAADRRLDLSTLRLGLVAGRSWVLIERLAARGPTLDLDGRLAVVPRGRWATTAALDWTLRPPGYPAAAGHTRIDGRLLGTLNLEQTLTRPFDVDLKASVKSLFSSIEWNGFLEMKGVDPHAIDPAWPRLTAALAIKLSGTAHRIHADGGVRLDAPRPYAFDIALDAGLQTDRIELQRLLLASVDRPGRLEVHGAIDLGKRPQVDLGLAWTHVGWPLDTDHARVSSPRGTAAVRGGLASWTLSARTGLVAGEFDAGTWNVEVRGDETTVELSRLDGHWLGGEIAATGTLELGGRRNFRLAVQARNLELTQLHEEIAGSASFDLLAKGGLRPLAANLTLERLNGKVNGRRLSGSARLAYAGSALDLGSAELALGTNRFSASGECLPRLDLAWQLHAPALVAFERGLSGALEASGTATGTPAAPRLQGSARLDALKWRTLSLASARADFDVATGPKPAAAIKLRMENLRRGSLAVDRLEAVLEGPADAQRLALALESPAGRLTLAAHGALTADRWSGMLDSADIAPVRAPAFSLKRPAALALGLDQLALKNACWSDGKGAEVCLDGTSNRQAWRVAGELRDFPLALADPFLADGLELGGTLDAALRGSGGDGHLKVALDASTRQAQASRLVSGERQRLQFSRIALTARVDDRSARARMNASLAGGGTVDADLALPWREHEKLAGRLHLVAHLKDLSELEVLTTQVTDVAGRLDADITVAGSPGDARFGGEAVLSDGALTLVRTGTRLRDLRLRLRGTGRGADFEAQARDADDGRLQATGTLDETDTGWALQARIGGKDFRVVDMPEARVSVTPDLALAVAGRKITLRGSVAVPSAQLKPPEFAGAIEPSPDLVVVGRETIRGQSPWQLTADLRITLGSDVVFTGYGLSAHIGGRLQVGDKPGELTTASGELNIIDGKYTAYGQDLTIERGRLLFSGGPIANPGLDIRATRTVGLVVAGLTVTGTLKSPKLQVFSNPPMSQSDALAYLLFGHGMQQTSGSEKSTFNSAANALGIAGGTYIAKSLSKHVGVDTVSVENASPYETGANQASLFLGKYLSPRVYVSYGIGLFAPINLFRVRYELSRHWALEAESGTISGADILYNIEH